MTRQRCKSTAGKRVKDSILRRKYVIPFILACVILFCNTATGVNSIIGYNTGILLQSGLSDVLAHWGYVILTLVNFLMTIVGMTLVDKKGRKFLLILGTSGIVISIITVGLLFRRTEKGNLMPASPYSPLSNRIRPSHFISTTPAAQKLLAASGHVRTREPHVLRRDLLLWRLHRGHNICPLRRCRSGPNLNQSCKLRPQPTGSRPSSRIPSRTSKQREPHPSRSIGP